jgi:predicted phosphodiesterase
MRLLVLGDIHLHDGSDRAASDDFAALVERTLEEGPFRLVLSGDVYDLAVAGSAPLRERLEAIDAWHPRFHEALCRVCRAGGDVVFVPGNHDAEMVEPEGRAFFESRVPGARVSTWFHREPGVAHVEHGHQYDPDNAQPHPLASLGDPLGVLLTRTLLARLGDLRLLRVAHATPIPIVVQCFIGYGLRTPGLIALYAWIGMRTVLRGDRGFAAARAAGRDRARQLADERGLPAVELHDLAALSARSVLENRLAAFRRMYLDRLFASIAVALGGLAAVFGLLKLTSAAEIALAAVAVVLVTVLSPNRYVGLVQERLRTAAHRIAATAGAPRVIFGHAHQVHDDGTYLNTGSFGMPPRGVPRSWVMVHQGVATHGTMMPGAILPAAPQRPGPVLETEPLELPGLA